MGDKAWQEEMLKATNESVTAKHNAIVLPQQKRVLKVDNVDIKKFNIDEEVRNKPRYRMVAKVGLFDLQLVVFARSNFWMSCTNIETTTHALSPPCYSGERGGVAVAFDLYGTSFCFAGLHLPGLRTPEHDSARRCLSHELLSGLTFGNRSFNADITNQFDYFFALGDFNAPLRTASRRTVLALYEAQATGTLNRFVSENCLLQREMSIDPQALLAEAQEARTSGQTSNINLFTLLGGKTKDLLHSDDGQLLNTGLILSGFREPIINFLPTYCIDINTGKFNTAKVLGPNYPDRILVKVPVYCPPVLDENGQVEKLLELDEELPPEEEEENSVDGMITVEDTEAEEGDQEVEEEEVEDEGSGDEGESVGAEETGKAEETPVVIPSITTEDIGLSAYPISCVGYSSSAQLRQSEHLPVSGVFICNVPRPLTYIFMRQARRAVITLTDLRATGVVFPFAKHAVFGETNREGASSKYNPINDAVNNSLELQISVNNAYLDPAVGIESVSYDISKFTSNLQDTATAAVAPPCKYVSTFTPELQLRMAIPTTPDHLMHAVMCFVVYDNKDTDVYRGRRGAARVGLMNFAGPVEAVVQKTLRAEPTWELLQVPFRAPLEIAGNRMGCLSGSIMVSYERTTEYTDEEEEHWQQQNP
eukprot:GILK01014785.1.p1 GENE.GILK01014785.1~~GILK01014785.1.p1  ORF type:complete len:669 (+),score=32.79 GILK01014785.1:61-2007(+)